MGVTEKALNEEKESAKRHKIKAIADYQLFHY